MLENFRFSIYCQKIQFSLALILYANSTSFIFGNSCQKTLTKLLLTCIANLLEFYAPALKEVGRLKGMLICIKLA